MDSVVSLDNVLVYIVGPYNAPSQEGIEQNIRQAEKVAIALAEAGIFFICPHLNTAHFGTKAQADESFYYRLGLKFVDVANVLLVLPGWEKSSGTLGEIERAKLRGKPIYFMRTLETKQIMLFINWLINKLENHTVKSDLL